MVAPRAVAPDPAGDLVAGVPGALRELLPEDADLAAVAVEGATMLRRPVSMARRRSSAVRPGNVVQPVPIAARAWASLFPTWARRGLGEAHDTIVPRSAERRGVEGLDGVRVHALVGVVEEEPMPAPRRCPSST